MMSEVMSVHLEFCQYTNELTKCRACSPLSTKYYINQQKNVSESSLARIRSYVIYFFISYFRMNFVFVGKFGCLAHWRHQDFESGGMRKRVTSPPPPPPPHPPPPKKKPTNIYIYIWYIIISEILDWKAKGGTDFTLYVSVFLYINSCQFDIVCITWIQWTSFKI